MDNMGNVGDLKDGITVSIPGTYYDNYHKWNLKFELINYKKNLIIPTNGCTKWFDYDRIKNTVLLRTRKEGDFFQIDELGGRKKLKSFFIDKKVPRELRDEIPLLTDGSHIMWIVGDRISEAYKVNEKTQRILIVKVDGGNKNG
jgi:tRNA(Ile)-lysidine synthase